jgi:pilus assembly protein CpaB
MSSSRLSALSYRLGGWPRRVGALLCLLLAAGSALGARSAASETPAGLPVVVAARDLAAGTVLAAADLRVAAWPSAIRPANVVDRVQSVLGRQMGGAIRAGEAVSSTRLIAGDIAAGLPPRMVAAPVELTSSAAGSLVQPGDWVDLLAAGRPDTGSDEAASVAPAQTVAERVRVLAVRSPSADAASEGTPIVVAVDRVTALRLAGAVGGALTVTVRSPP